MERKAYSTDVSDEEWAFVAPCLTLMAEDAPQREHSLREFVFKLQANMDPKHRDRTALLGICSGKFEKDMVVTHARTDKTIRLSRLQKLFAQDGKTLDVAYAGDVVGLNNPGSFVIGDRVCIEDKLRYSDIPSFSPELFVFLKNADPTKYKNFNNGDQNCKKKAQYKSSTQRMKVSAILFWQRWGSFSLKWCNSVWHKSMVRKLGSTHYPTQWRGGWLPVGKR